MSLIVACPKCQSELDIEHILVSELLPQEEISTGKISGAFYEPFDEKK